MKDFDKAGLNKYRVRKGPMATGDEMGNFGSFVIPLDRKTRAFITANDALEENGFVCDWEHVSIHVKRVNMNGKWIERTPTWEEMCRMKEMFFEDDECVMQLHVPKADWVNTHPHCLHLWRPEKVAIPRPPQYLV